MTVSTHTLRFLGTGASCGVPSFYCGCKACEEALSNPLAQRSCAALLIKGRQNTLIDAGPDLRMQLSRAGARNIERVLFTHEHSDHVGGIPQLEYYVRLSSKRPLPSYAGEHTLAAIEQQFPFMVDTIEPHALEAWQSVEFNGMRYTALPATHGRETFGFLIEKASGEGKRVAYFPDTGEPSAQVTDVLRGIDILIIDASFHGRNWMPESHLSIDEAIAYAQHIGAQKTFLTHLTMHYDEPLTARELQELLTPYRGAILAANDGLELKLD